MEQQRLHQEERVRRALERAKADPKKKVPYCHLLNCCTIYNGLNILFFIFMFVFIFFLIFPSNDLVAVR